MRRTGGLVGQGREMVGMGVGVQGQHRAKRLAQPGGAVHRLGCGISGVDWVRCFVFSNSRLVQLKCFSSCFFRNAFRNIHSRHCLRTKDYSLYSNLCRPIQKTVDQTIDNNVQRQAVAYARHTYIQQRLLQALNFVCRPSNMGGGSSVVFGIQTRAHPRVPTTTSTTNHIVRVATTVATPPATTECTTLLLLLLLLLRLQQLLQLVLYYCCMQCYYTAT